MQKSYLPLLISATVCSTLLADMTVSGSAYFDGPESGTNNSAQETDKVDLNFPSTLAAGLSVSYATETLDNDNTDADNSSTLGISYRYGFTGNYGTLYFGEAGLSHTMYNEDFPDANTLTTQIGLVYNGITLAANASTADNFWDAGSTQH
ncbi:MAG: hypothetical protein CMF43_01005, partial [Legionellales bacterium]|nr:hypothetical protein [Legionellales bacterium]